MDEQKQRRCLTKPLPSVREVIDNEFMTIGDDAGKVWRPEELEIHHRLGDLISAKLALGFTAEQINAMWAGKSSQEILADADANAGAPHATSAPGERAA